MEHCLRFAPTLGVAALLVAAACGSHKVPLEGDEGTSTGGGGTPSSMSRGATSEDATGAADTGESGTLTTSDEDSESSDDASFLPQPDAGAIPDDCDIYAQDCPEGFKCNTDGEVWACVPLAEDPLAVGEECESSGLGDNCVAGSMCSSGPSPDYVPRCVELCGGSADEPTCSEGRACHPWVPMWPVCHDTCDPLMQDCEGQHGCYTGVTEFACLPDHSDENSGGLFGQSCQGPYMCAPGLDCVLAAQAGCSGAACCTPYCDTDGPNTCPGTDQTCVPIAGSALPQPVPGLENAGLCLVL